MNTKKRNEIINNYVLATKEIEKIKTDYKNLEKALKSAKKDLIGLYPEGQNTIRSKDYAIIKTEKKSRILDSEKITQYFKEKIEKYKKDSIRISLTIKSRN